MTDWHDDPEWVWEPDSGYIGGLDDKYRWNAWGDSCPICTAMNGRVHTLDYWAATGLWVGFHPNCDCTMKKVPPETPLSDEDFWGAVLPCMYNFRKIGTPAFMWDTKHEIKPFAASFMEQIESMHIAMGADSPIGDVMKAISEQLAPGFFQYKDSFFGDHIGWRILRTRQKFEQIDGSFDGSDAWQHANYIVPIYEAWAAWFKRMVYKLKRLKPPFGANEKFSLGNQYQSIPFRIQPLPLRPYYPFQSFYTEVD